MKHPAEYDPMPLPTQEIVYRESNGEPMGENSIQIKWILSLLLNFERLYQDRPDVTVAADLFWYPVEGRPDIATAPDVMVAFGRPKGERSIYKQWEEGGVAPQVVIEVLSPSNTYHRRGKLARFYARHGVEEFYEYDPDARVLTMRLRAGRRLGPIVSAHGHTSARLGVRFEVPPGEELRVIGPDGTPFLHYHEMVREKTDYQEQLLAERRKVADAERRAAAEARKAAEARAENERLLARLRELGIDPDAV